jgi:hypothetical protein
MSRINGIAGVKNGRVILLKNITDLKASVADEDLHSVLQTLSLVVGRALIEAHLRGK